MGRDVLRVDGVSAETKQALQGEALRLYGQSNASLLVRELIAAHFAKGGAGRPMLTKLDAADRQRVTIRLPRAALARVDEDAEARFSKRNYYIVSIVMSHIGQPQLQPDQIEVLRSSNYELSKIGTNLNQIARAFNILVRAGGGKPPEIGKKIASLRRDITSHIGKVLRALEHGTVIHETSGRGQYEPPKNRKAKNAKSRSKQSKRSL